MMCSPSFIQVLFQSCPAYTCSSFGARGLDLDFYFLLCFPFLPLPEDCDVLTRRALQGQASVSLLLPDPRCDTSGCVPYPPVHTHPIKISVRTEPHPAGLPPLSVPFVPLAGLQLCFRMTASLRECLKDLQVPYVQK